MLENLEIENALLAILIRGEAWNAIAGRVSADDFAAPEHQAIFEVISELAESGKKISPATLNTKLDPDYHDYTRELFGSPVTLIKADAVYWADKIRDYAERRGLVVAAESLKEAAENDERPAVDIAASLIADLSKTAGDGRDFEDSEDVACRVVDDLRHPMVTYPTGLHQLDDAICGGFMPGRFYGIGGRMKAGKSMLAGTISYNMAMAGIPHLYLTLESSPDEIMHRHLARAMGINAMSFLNPKSRNDPQLAANAAKVIDRFKARGLIFQKRPRMRLDDLRSTISRAALSGKVKGVFVDYLQLVAGAGKEGLVTHYENVAQTLAECAKQYGVWIVTPFQINQEGGARYGEGIIAACDMALFLGKVEAEYQHEHDRAWLEMKASRFTPMNDIGSEGNPAFTIDRKIGPHFRDALRYGEQAA